MHPYCNILYITLQNWKLRRISYYESDRCIDGNISKEILRIVQSKLNIPVHSDCITLNDVDDADDTKYENERKVIS